MYSKFSFCLILLCGIFTTYAQHIPAGEEALGTKSYDQYEKPAVCKSCHTDIYQQWTQAMMSQAYTHHWDEIEYFDLAVEHSKKDPFFKAASDGCNGMWGEYAVSDEGDLTWFLGSTANECKPGTGDERFNVMIVLVQAYEIREDGLWLYTADDRSSALVFR